MCYRLDGSVPGIVNIRQRPPTCQESAVYSQTLSSPLIGRLAGDLALPKAEWWGLRVIAAYRYCYFARALFLNLLAAALLGNGVVFARRQLESEELRRSRKLLCEAQNEVTYLRLGRLGLF